MADFAPKIVIDDTPKRAAGRPRKEEPIKPTATAINADVRKAMATLESAYNLIATGLTLFGLEKSANEWIDSAEQLKLTNEDALRASPALAKRIASLGSTGGSATFILTHGMAFAGLFNILRTEVADKRADAILKRDPVPDDSSGI